MCVQGVHCPEKNCLNYSSPTLSSSVLFTAPCVAWRWWMRRWIRWRTSRWTGRWTRRWMRRWTRRWTGRCAISLIACDRLVQRGVFKRRQCPSVVLEPTRRRRPTASPTTDQCSCDSQPREALCSHQKCSHQKCSHRKCSHERLPPKVLEVSDCRCDRSSNDLKTLFPTL